MVRVGMWPASLLLPVSVPISVSVFEGPTIFWTIAVRLGLVDLYVAPLNFHSVHLINDLSNYLRRLESHKTVTFAPSIHVLDDANWHRDG